MGAGGLGRISAASNVIAPSSPLGGQANPQPEADPDMEASTSVLRTHYDPFGRANSQSIWNKAQELVATAHSDEQLG